MDSIVIQLGVGGIFAVLTLKLVFDFLNARNKPSLESIQREVMETRKKTQDLWEWHNVSDPHTGLKSWYTPRESQAIMTGVRREVGKQTDAIHELCHKITEIDIKIDNLA